MRSKNIAKYNPPLPPPPVLHSAGLRERQEIEEHVHKDNNLTSSFTSFNVIFEKFYNNNKK